MPVSPHSVGGGRAMRRMRMLDVEALDKWLSLNSHKEECLHCGAQQLACAAFEIGSSLRRNEMQEVSYAIVYSDG